MPRHATTPEFVTVLLTPEQAQKIERLRKQLGMHSFAEVIRALVDAASESR